MITTNTLTPIPAVVPAIPTILETLGLGAGAIAALKGASKSRLDPLELTGDEASEAIDFFSSIPDAYGNQMHRFLATASPRPVPEEVIQPTYVHAGWNRINGGYRYYDPNLGMTTETFIDPVIINGTYTSPYNPTASLTAEPTIKMTPLVNTIQRSTPIRLSSGQVVVLPTDFTDYRVFDETSDSPGDNGTSGEESDNSGTVAVDDTSTTTVNDPVPPAPEEPENEEPKKKRYRDRRKERLNRPEPEGNWDEYLRGIDRQGMPSKINNPSFGEEWLRWPRASYGLGYITRFLGTPGGLLTLGGAGTGLFYLGKVGKNANQNTTKSTTTSEAGINTGALEDNTNTGTSSHGEVGSGWTVIYSEPGYNPTNSGASVQNQGTTDRQVINLSEMDSIDSLYNSRR